MVDVAAGIICAGIEWAIIDDGNVLFCGTRNECEQIQVRMQMGFSIDHAIEFVESQRSEEEPINWIPDLVIGVLLVLLIGVVVVS